MKKIATALVAATPNRFGAARRSLRPMARIALVPHRLFTPLRAGQKPAFYAASRRYSTDCRSSGGPCALPNWAGFPSFAAWTAPKAARAG